MMSDPTLTDDPRGSGYSVPNGSSRSIASTRLPSATST